MNLRLAVLALCLALAGCGGGGGGSVVDTVGGGGGGGGTGGGGGGGGGGPSTPPPTFTYATWFAAPQFSAERPNSQPRGTPPTVSGSWRFVARISVGGTRIRVKLSNLFGTVPVTFSAVTVAERPATFAGTASLTLQPGTEMWSDDVEQVVARGSDVTIVLTLPGPMVMETWHQFPDGDVYWVSGLAASGTTKANVVAAFGDSLTDGSGATRVDARYPYQLAARLAALGDPPVSVVSAGIGGNRWLYDFRGPSGASRFERDVLGLPGITHTIIMMGVNDFQVAVASSTEKPTLEGFMAAVRNAIVKSRARNVKVLLGTIAPWKGSPFFRADEEAIRRDFNAWVRSLTANDGVDGVVDFDAALRNPNDPGALAPEFDSGDHVHPNDAGYAAMAAAVDLSKLR